MFSFLFSTLFATDQMTAPTTYNITKTIGQFLPFILIAVIFYFFIIRPQSKQRQLLSEMIKNLENGDKVITKGGIIGKISDISENFIILELHDGTKIKILKNAIISLMDEKE